jgi:hypothetical protein
MYLKRKRLVCIMIVVVFTLALLPFEITVVSAESDTEPTLLLETMTNIASGTSNHYFPVSFEAGKAYSVTASWSSKPSFEGSRTGWKLQTAADQTGQNIGDLILKTAKKDSTDVDKAVQTFTCVFIASHDMPLLNLHVQGLTTANSVSITVEPSNMSSNVLLDTTISVADGTKYLNAYFDVNFVQGTTYTISAEWTNVPTYTGSTTAWKIQGTEDATVDGNGTVIYRATRNTSTNTAAQTYSGTFTPSEDIPVFNFFTQSVNDANQIHIRIESIPQLSATFNVDAGNSNKYITYPFEAGKAYAITASWANIPVFSGSLTGWRLQTVQDSTGMTVGDIIIKTAKKESTIGNGNSIQTYTGIFIPTQHMPVLNLYTQGLVTSNSITISVAPAPLQEGLLLDATISVDADMEYISAYFDLEFEVGKSYAISASWASPPVYTAANEGKTAWKIQAAQDSNVAGDDTIIYKTTASNNTATQSFTGIFSCITAKPVFNFFAQRLNGENQIHFKIELFDEPPVSFISDQATYQKLFNVSRYSNGKIMQAFDIFNDIVFQCYDSGECVTYDLTTGSQIASFQLGSAYSTNHCGNANFGVEYPEGNTQFPALYVSGDLTTKACYVENVTATSAQLIQTIYFDIEPSYTGGQVIIDRDRNRILYMQRQNPNIRDIYNVYKICEFRIPSLSEGPVIRFTNADILGEPYELSYYSPLYQGATIYQGRILQTHGLAANSFGSRVGLMNFDVFTHTFDRHIDMTNPINQEPQGITVYQDRLIMNFIDGNFYEIKLNLDVQQSDYQIAIPENIDDLKAKITAAVTEHLSQGFSVTLVELPEDFVLTGANQDFTAKLSIRTPYNIENVDISGVICTL